MCSSDLTQHLMGDGWWAWMIPLKGGDTSVGAVFHRDSGFWAGRVDPDRCSLEQRFRAALGAHPAARALLANATCVEGDVHVRGNLEFRWVMDE